MIHSAVTTGLMRCQRCGVRRKAVCGALSDEELAALSAVARQRLVKAGEMIINAEEEATSFANIVTGAVKLFNLLGDGRQQIVGLQFPPDFLGRAYRTQSPYFAQAATDVELCVFPKRGFEALMAEHPELETKLFQNTLDELDAARDWMILLGRKTAAEKVASFIALIVRRSFVQDCDQMQASPVMTVFLPLARADIADYLGLTIETVSRQIGKLSSDHILEVGANRSITVLDPGRLADLAQI